MAQPNPNRKSITQTVAERSRPPAEGHITLWDSNCPGFGLRISAKGRRTWICMYRVAGGPQVMETIGTMAVIPSVATARELARASMLKAKQGIHPVHERQQRRVAAQAEAEQQAFTFNKLVADFISKYHERRKHSRPSTIYTARRLLNRAVVAIGDKPVCDITDADIRKLVDTLADSRLRTWRGESMAPASSEANNVLAQLGTLFRWAVKQNLVDSNPTAKIEAPFDSRRERDRVLSDPELVAVWQACEQTGWPFGKIIQLLLLTGQRVGEVGGLPWSELDVDHALWHLPGARAKNGKAHDIPLSDQAMAIIHELPRIDGSEFVFPGRDSIQPIKDFFAAKQRINSIVEPKMAPWVLHDIRRTVATGLQKLGIRLEVTEATLNHISGSRRGIVGIYQRHDYAEEKRAALTAWGRFVDGLVRSDTRRNVVTLRAG
jgi:integrase